MMWTVPVIVGWVLAFYVAAVYIGRWRMRLWILLMLVAVFAAAFAWWGFWLR